jgi:hypothetical protein
MFAIHARSMQTFRTWVLGLAWFGVLVCAVLLIAKWGSALLSPRPVASLATGPVTASPVTLDDTLKLFGKVSAADPQALGLELTGIYAARRNKGFATFNSPNGPRSISVGAEIQPGLRLVAASARDVTVRGTGSEWRLELKTALGSQKNQRSPVVFAR